VRAQQTAQACADALGLPIETDARLMEFGSGALSPFTLAEMIELAPYDDIWHPEDAAWDGETIGAFWQRTGEAAEAIWQAGGRPLIVSHVGTTQGILRWSMRIPPAAPDSFSLFVGNASLTEIVVRVDRHGRRRADLHRLGATDHLSTTTDI
jgi:probable phosphoglycerate mutase